MKETASSLPFCFSQLTHFFSSQKKKNRETSVFFRLSCALPFLPFFASVPVLYIDKFIHNNFYFSLFLPPSFSPFFPLFFSIGNRRLAHDHITLPFRHVHTSTVPFPCQGNHNLPSPLCMRFIFLLCCFCVHVNMYICTIHPYNTQSLYYNKGLSLLPFFFLYTNKHNAIYLLFPLVDTSKLSGDSQF